MRAVGIGSWIRLRTGPRDWIRDRNWYAGHLTIQKREDVAALYPEAQALAERSKNENDREAWLRIARGWLGLIQSKHVTPDDKFEEANCGSRR